MDLEIIVKRVDNTNISSIGTFTIDNRFKCYSLEDKDRGLKQSDSQLWIKAKKIFGVTAIPIGRYQVALTYSQRFKKIMPEILNVPGYAGVRIHPGNNAGDTEGCILVGYDKGKDFIGRSRDAYADLMAILTEADAKGKIHITIQ